MVVRYCKAPKSLWDTPEMKLPHTGEILTVLKDIKT